MYTPGKEPKRWSTSLRAKKACYIDQKRRKWFRNLELPVYHEFARYFVSQGRGMDLTYEAGLSKTTLQMPFGFVDWSFDIKISCFNYGRTISGAHWSCLEGLKEAGKHDAELALTKDPSITSVRGAIFDSLVSVTAALDLVGRVDEVYQKILRIRLYDVRTSKEP